MLANATRICEAKFGNMFAGRDGCRDAAIHGAPPAHSCCNACATPMIGAGAHPLARVIEPSNWSTSPISKDADHAEASRPPSPASNRRRPNLLIVPMLKEHELIGALFDLPAGGAPLHRQADRVADKLRRAGRHRHRESRLLSELRNPCSSRPLPQMFSR